MKWAEIRMTGIVGEKEAAGTLEEEAVGSADFLFSETSVLYCG
jgi:hypothetical protein